MDQLRPAFGQRRTWARARNLLYSTITCLGRHTITGLLCNTAQQFADWSAAYRIFEQERFDAQVLWERLRGNAVAACPPEMPLVAALDDTLLGKRGRKVAGTSWRRDPLGPHFCTNFIWAQRFVQASLLIPKEGWLAGARAVPIDLRHAPTPHRPRPSAPAAQWDEYREQQRALCLGQVARRQISDLRRGLDADERSKGRKLLIALDGGYTNRTVFKDIPEDTVLVGRIRRDAQLHAVPDQQSHGGRGRPRYYGDALPTPEQIRQDPSIPWQTVRAHAAGTIHEFEVKVLTPVRWKPAGSRDLTLIVVRPLAYRPRKGARLLYRNPAYLICTDPNTPVEQALQTFLWRWEVEVGFRDEKTVFGMGEAQVRTQAAAELVPTFVAASYALLHIGAALANIAQPELPLPKWRCRQQPKRASTAQLVNRVRAELWGRGLGIGHNIDGFANKHGLQRSILNAPNQVASAVVYAMR